MTETYSEVADAANIARFWPDGRDMPALIGEVAEFLRPLEWRSLGATRMIGDRMDDYWIENGCDLWRDFGVFMRLPDGSRVAQWFKAGDSGAEPPIVLIGSEGEQRVLAPDLPAFLAAWALARFNDDGALVASTPAGDVTVELPSDLIRGEDEDDDGIADNRSAFAAFLDQRLGRRVTDLVKPSPGHAAFEQFFTAWGETARAEIAANPNLQAIAKILDADIPRGKEIWERASFRVAAIGERIEIGGKSDPRKPLSEDLAGALRPLIQAERVRRAGGVHAVRGLWNSGNILLYPDGVCQIAADWDAAPQFRHGPAAQQGELAAELAQFPKTARWRAPWMRELDP